jgi:hypothetical protein
LRTTAGSALALLIAGACAAPAAAATLDAPGSIAAREVVAVTATGLEPGRWAVFLSAEDYAGRPCLGRLARRTAESDQPTVFGGVVPSQLRCQGDGDAAQVPPAPVAPLPVRPGGGYRFVVCLPGGSDCAVAPAARRSVHVVRTGRACENVVFTPGSDNGAFSIHARNVGCRVARHVARGAGDSDRAYRRAGLRCRGVFDAGAPLPQTIYRCTRPGARVTFSAS